MTCLLAEKCEFQLEKYLGKKNIQASYLLLENIEINLCGHLSYSKRICDLLVGYRKRTGCT